MSTVTRARKSVLALTSVRPCIAGQDLARPSLMVQSSVLEIRFLKLLSYYSLVLPQMVTLVVIHTSKCVVF